MTRLVHLLTQTLRCPIHRVFVSRDEWGSGKTRTFFTPTHPKRSENTMLHTMSRKLAAIACAAFATLATTTAAHAQASYAGTGPGSYLTLGATFSGFQSGQYGQTTLTGGSLYLDANLYRRLGVEAEARSLNHGSLEGIRETSYLVGPKLSLKGRRLRPYAKFLVGRGDFRFPFGYAYGKYFVMAPGAGIDWRIHHSRFSLRLIDAEYQIWPNFIPFGKISPYGASAGLSFQLSDPKR